MRAPCGNAWRHKTGGRHLSPDVRLGILIGIVCGSIPQVTISKRHRCEMTLLKSSGTRAQQVVSVADWRPDARAWRVRGGFTQHEKTANARRRRPLIQV